MLAICAKKYIYSSTAFFALKAMKVQREKGLKLYIYSLQSAILQYYYNQIRERDQTLRTRLPRTRTQNFIENKMQNYYYYICGCVVWFQIHRTTLTPITIQPQLPCSEFVVHTTTTMIWPRTVDALSRNTENSETCVCVRFYMYIFICVRISISFVRKLFTSPVLGRR